MIAIHKGAVPDGLANAGDDHSKQLLAAYESHPEWYTSGKNMGIRKSIYSSNAVKAALLDCHHGKCCYCEAHIPRPWAYCHVEHWRPKGSYRQERDGQRVRPGYYWLAYSWDNLLQSCAPCNSNKSDLFPLENPTARATNPKMPIQNEIPAILRPDGEIDPRDHITFHMERAIGLTPLGRRTIEVLKLNREAIESRLTHLRRIENSRKKYLDLIGIDHPVARQHAEDERKFVEEAVRPEMPYSSMVAVYLEKRSFGPTASVVLGSANGS